MRFNGLLIAFSAILVCAAPARSLGQTASPPLSAKSLQTESFPLLTQLAAAPMAEAALAGRPEHRRIAGAVRERLRTAAAACEAALAERAVNRASTRVITGCEVSALRWTDEERAVSAGAAGRAFDAEPALRTLVRDRLRPSGFYALYADADDRTLFTKAWRDLHRDLDRAIRVYGLGETPRFADIDSAIYPVTERYYQGLLGNLIRETAIAAPAEAPAWDVPRRLAYDLMDFNRRDDAPRQRRLEDAENAAAARRMAGLDWSAWPYTLILVPGYSPELAYEPLNPGAKLRIRRGVALWRAGKAPFLVVSGGTLRPVGTEVNEALSMKRHLIDAHGVPEAAILIDPVARHTTTNLRNTVRLIYKHSMPTDKPALVAGNSVPYIASDAFRERNLRELGYVPFAPGRRLDFETLEFRPVPAALHRDATDPMDP